LAITCIYIIIKKRNKNQEKINKTEDQGIEMRDIDVTDLDLDADE